MNKTLSDIQQQVVDLLVVADSLEIHISKGGKYGYLYDTESYCADECRVSVATLRALINKEAVGYSHVDTMTNMDVYRLWGDRQ